METPVETPNGVPAVPKEQPAANGTPAEKANGAPVAAETPVKSAEADDDDVPLSALAANNTPAKPATNGAKPAAPTAAKPATPATAKSAAKPPASTTPKPAASGTPKPAATTTPKPAASTTPKPPASTTPKPAASGTPAKPGATTTPKPAAPKPAAGTPAKPAADGSKPASTTTPKPAANAAKPAAAGTPKPAATPSKPAASSTPKPAATPSKPAEDDDDDVPLSTLSKKSATPKAADSVAKTKETTITSKATPKGTTTTSTTVTTAKTHTPTASSKVTTTDTLTTVKKEKDESDDDDKPLSTLVHKVSEVKKEKKDNLVVRKEKETTKVTEVKEEKKAPKKEVKKEAEKKPTPKKRKPESSDESEEEKPKKKKKAKVESDSDEEEKPKKKKKAKEEDEEKPKKKKKKGEEEDDEGDWKWWEEEALPDGKKWISMAHNGVMFAEPYKPHGVKFYYDGKPVDLSPEAEEVATFYAKYLETDHTKKDVFNSNFWGEFRSYLTPEQKKVIKDFKKADFTHIHKYLVEEKEKKDNRSAEEKKAEKAEKERLLEMYGYAMINGHRQRVSNWAIEKPGLFLGRGAHPKTGLVKKRIEAEDITINISKGAKVPEPPPGHKWAKVVHDDKVAWLAMWKENINNGFKYVWLHASSAVKGRSDMKKFETARNLKGHIDKIRKQYTKELTDDELETRQRSTALYLIDKLALRVGNEKDDDTADTVGCCSLRVEHVTLKEPNSLTLDFLGKDSMRYHNTVDVDTKVFKNIREFLHKPGKKADKAPEDDLFDQLTTSALNKYLKDFMNGLSAKVFRTFNASLTLEKELAKMPKELMKATNDEKVLFFNRCNREVAILCNHQRTLSKTHGESMAKIDQKIAEFEHKKDKLKKQILFLKGKGPKPEESESESEEEDSTPKKGKKTPEKTPKKETKTKKEKDDDDFESKSKKRKTPEKGDEDDFKETPKKKQKRGLPDDVEKCRNAIERVDASINKWVIKKTEKDELKSVALTTSKINYIDPRITVAWAKKVKLPVEKLFSKSLRDKFPWAMSVDEDWEF